MTYPWSADRLSSAALRCWGKSSHIGDMDWMPLHRHMSDSASVARHLYEHFLPESVRDRIAAPLPGGHLDALNLCGWLAGVHDIGKATPAFAIQVPTLFTTMEYQGLTARAEVRTDRRIAPHATAGMIILDQWLADRHDWEPGGAKQFSVVVGGHHGLPPDTFQYEQARAHSHLLGWSKADNPDWRHTQYELLDWATRSSGVLARLPAWRRVELSQPVQVLLTGLVIMADWIASNPALFPYRDDRTFDPDRISDGLDALDLTEPWHAVAPETTEDLLTLRFGLPGHYRLRPVQRAALTAAADMPAPGLMIIEAPMGEGKTEAALLAAETLAARCGAGGCFIALPTRATSDALYDRTLEWARRLPDRRTARGAHSIALAHGKAYFNTEFTKLFHFGLPSAIAQDESDPEGKRPGAELIAHWWMAGRKKNMFNSFVVGTIDQLLFSALKAKHLAMRHLGLAGKVVIIDEAHAYDVYMGVYLDMALEWLGAYGVPVIILSATLPAERRRHLMAAYERGREGPRPRQGRRGRTAAPEPYPRLRGDIGYPAVITGGRGGSADVRVIEPSGRATDIELRTLDDHPEALTAAMRDELAEGGCALVIRNTVRRVQETAAYLREEFGDIVTVAHSRFTAPDRAAKDQRLRELFGPPGNGHERPKKHIVVASQVAEQSLDIDFDVLFTDLAPVDLVLQRMGRVHRHERPERTRPARCHLTGADWDTTPPEPVAGSVRVYGRWPLLRSAAALLPHLADGTTVALPADIAPLVQDAYADRPLGPQSWQEDIAAALKEDERKKADQRDRAEKFRLRPPQAPGKAVVGWLYAGGHLDDEDSPAGRAMVRDIPADSLEVVLIARDGDRYTTLPWLRKHGGVALPTETCPEDGLARVIAATTLSLPIELSGEAVITELEGRHDWLESWQASRCLEGQLVLDIDPAHGTELAGHHLEYDQHDGLRVRKL